MGRHSFLRFGGPVFSRPIQLEVPEYITCGVSDHVSPCRGFGEHRGILYQQAGESRLPGLSEQAGRTRIRCNKRSPDPEHSADHFQQGR